MNELPYLDTFLSYLRLEKTLSENTVVSYRFDLQRLFSFLDQHRIENIDEVKPDLLSKYIRVLFDIGPCDFKEPLAIPGIVMVN